MPRTVPTNGSAAVSNPSIVHRGAGLLGESLALGFWRKDPVLGGTDFVASFSEDSGSTWLPPITCGAASPGDTLAGQGSRTFCIQATPTTLQWAEWTGAAWGGAQTLIEISGVSAAPSATESADGRLHLVAGTGGGEVLHTALPGGSSSWAPPVPIGAGVAPVIATDGGSLYVYAADPQSFAESLIRRYSSEDGLFWSATPALSGAPFGYVLDYDASWAFEALAGAALFSLTDQTGTSGSPPARPARWTRFGSGSGRQAPRSTGSGFAPAPPALRAMLG
ncbi:MAG: hypothetical protein HY775_11200 [Acidobacteria bacterium]|nr:hypothetical protein [Acidobacteriota bacterium]